MFIHIEEKYAQIEETRKFAQEVEKLAEKHNLKIEITATVNGTVAYANVPASKT